MNQNFFYFNYANFLLILGDIYPIINLGWIVYTTIRYLDIGNGEILFGNFSVSVIELVRRFIFKCQRD